MMKNTLKKSAHLTLDVILWGLGLFFVLGSIAYISQSLPAAFTMLILGLCLIPPAWRLLEKKNPAIFSKNTRIVAALLLFALAVTITPTTETQPPETTKAAVVQKDESKNDTPKDSDELLSRLTFKDNSYILSGSGKGDTEYTLVLSDSPNITVHTDHEGRFEQTLPDTTQVFGSIKLTRDTNGGWLGGKETYDTKFFTLNADHSVLSSELPTPVTLGIGKTGQTYEISGYYMPTKKLVLRAGESLLSTALVDYTGRFVFRDIPLTSNFAEVSVYETVSTGWFSSEEQQLGNTAYLNKDSLTIHTELPITTKVITVVESIPFTPRSVESTSLEKGKTSVTQAGSNGERKKTFKVTYKGNDETGRELIKDTVSKQPVDEVTTVGTYVYVAPPTYSAPAQQKTQQAPQTASNGRTGAICRDGSRSSAKGSGACSHHGGVSQWLY